MKCPDGITLQDITKLPKNLATLKARTYAHMPLMNMCKAPIFLKVEKLPIDMATQKRNQQGKGKELETQTTDLHFIDPTSTFEAIMVSNIREDMHTCPRLIIDKPTELFHFRA